MPGVWFFQAAWGIRSPEGYNTAIVMIRMNVELASLRPPASRPFADPGKVQRMGAFDWSKYVPIIVEKDGHVLTIQDGMTRIEVARQAAITRLPAYVFESS